MKKPVDWKARVRKIMTVRGWARIDVAEAVGVSARTVEGWDLGYHRPDGRSRRVLRVIWREVMIEEAARDGKE